MEIIVIDLTRGLHQHCDLCNKCLTEGVLHKHYSCPRILIELNDSPPMEFDPNWVVCVECAVLVEDRDVTAMFDRFMSAARDRYPDNNWSEDAVDTARRIIVSFDSLREKSRV